MSEGKLEVVVCFKCSEQLASELKKIAEASGVTVSEICRKAVENFIRNDKQNPFLKWTILRPKPLMRFLQLVENAQKHAFGWDKNDK